MLDYLFYSLPVYSIIIAFIVTYLYYKEHFTIPYAPSSKNIAAILVFGFTITLTFIIQIVLFLVLTL